MFRSEDESQIRNIEKTTILQFGKSKFFVEVCLKLVLYDLSVQSVHLCTFNLL